MKEIMKLLKFGATKENYPPYGNYLHSTGKSLHTCNDEVYVSLNEEMPFEGDINMYVFDDILSKFEFDELNIKQEGDILNVSKDKYKTQIHLAEPDMPIIQKPKVEMIDITEDLLKEINLASKFLGKDEYSNLILDSNCIYATDKSRIYFVEDDSRIEESNKEPIVLNKKMVSLLSIGIKIGTFKGNTVIEFDNGFMMFVNDSIKKYPKESIKEFSKKTREDYGIFLCNVGELKNATDKLSPILFGESQKVVRFFIKNGKLCAEAESSLNGKSEVEIIKVPMKANLFKDFSINFDISIFKDIPLSFKIYIPSSYSESEVNRVFLLEDTYIGVLILIGRS